MVVEKNVGITERFFNNHYIRIIGMRFTNLIGGIDRHPDTSKIIYFRLKITYAF